MERQTPEWSRAKPVAEFVDEQGFQIIGALALRRGEPGGRGEGRLAVVAEERVGIEDLAGEYGGAGRAHRDSRRVGGDHAGEGEDACGEGRARLVEADGVESIDVVFLVVRAGAG